MKQNFIKTADKETADKLKLLGFQMIGDFDGIYTFLNCAKLNFSDDINQKKIHYSNILTMQPLS